MTFKRVAGSIDWSCADKVNGLHTMTLGDLICIEVVREDSVDVEKWLR